MIHIACGHYHSVAISEEGEIYLWGTFSTEIAPLVTPTLIPLENERVTFCTCNADSVLLLTGANNIRSMGGFFFFIVY